MQKLKLILFSCFLLIFCLYSCSYSEEWTKVEKNNFSIEMPPYTKAMENISTNPAALEWGSYFKNFYIIIKEHNNQNIEALAENSKQELLSNSNFHKARTSKTRNLKINEQNAIEWIIRGGVGREALREEITYHHYFVDGKNKIYELILWNWTARDEEFKPDIDKIVASFQLL